MKGKTYFMLTHLVLASILAQQPKQDERHHSLTGQVKRIADFESKTLGNKRGIWIYTPPGYDSSKDSYPVLYMHDGQNIFDGFTSYIPNQEWRVDEAVEALINTKLLKPIIVVGIENTGMSRADEYLPTKARTGQNEVGGKADDYGKFMSDELMPWVAKTYRVKAGPKNTGIAGSSFGGIISLYLGLKQPERYGRLGIVSPSIWWDNRMMLDFVAKQPRKETTRIWIDAGTQEGKDTVQDTRDTVQVLEKSGYKVGQDLAYYEDGYADHSERAWARRVGLMIYWLFKD